MQNTPKISIIVPIHNVENYLPQALDSLTNQTLRDIEFICVDDASTDSSTAILREYSSRDPRFSPIYFDENLSTNVARKRGVMAASGKYIMFLDGDDYLEPNACEHLYNEMERRGADILHFGTNVVCADEAAIKSAETTKLQDYIAPYEGLITDNLIKRAFIEKLWSYALWNKITKRDICVKAFSALTDRHIVLAEDIYASFLIHCFATSYVGVYEPRLYNYRYGQGITGAVSDDFAIFEKKCDRIGIIEDLTQFATASEREPDVFTAIDTLKDIFINDTLDFWFNNLNLKYKSRGFDMMCSKWGEVTAISYAQRKFCNKSANIYRFVKDAQILAKRKMKIKTIAMYYYGLTGGGAERVMSELSFIWSRMGYRIIILTENEPTAEDYPIAEGTIRAVMPSYKNITEKFYYLARAKAIRNIIETYNVDLFDYNAWESYYSMWDAMLIKSLGAAILYHSHNVFADGMELGHIGTYNRTHSARFMDALAVLSRVDMEYWKAYNRNTHYIRNPINKNLIEMSKQAPLDGHTIAWVSRIAAVKQPFDAIDVFKLVKQSVPDAKLLMLGSSLDENLVSEVREYISRNGLSESIEVAGFVQDIENRLEKSSIMMHTSVFEGYPMAIQEACFYGLPVVMYEIEYLEQTRQCPSIITVPQRDIMGMASRIVELLNDLDYRKRVGASIRAEVLNMTSDSLEEKWKALFDTIENPNIIKTEPTNCEILTRSLLYYYSLGVGHKDKIISEKAALSEKSDISIGKLIPISGTRFFGRRTVREGEC